MITEDYVSFEIANLLKEKGFEGECSRFYMPNGNGRWKYEHYHDFDISDRIECPTLQMAIKWLRVKFNIHIEVVPKYIDYSNKLYYYGLIYQLSQLGTENQCTDVQETPELVYDNAIRYILEKSLV